MSSSGDFLMAGLGCLVWLAVIIILFYVVAVVVALS
jgi:hypothetical protein